MEKEFGGTKFAESIRIKQITRVMDSKLTSSFGVIIVTYKNYSVTHYVLRY